MARPLASSYPSSYGYGRKPQAIEDEPDYLRKDAVRKARPVVPAIGGGALAIEEPQAKPSSSTTPQAVQDQMLQQNLQRRATAFDQEQSGFAQSDRNAKAIYANNVANSQASPVTREQDYANMMARPGMPNAVAPVAPAAPQAVAQPNMQAPAVNNVMGPRSPFDTMPAGSGGGQVSGPVPVPAVAPATPTYNPNPLARLAQNPSVAVSGPAQDALAINSRVQAIPQIQNQFGGDVGAYQRSQQVAAANQQMTRPQAVAPPNPVDAFGQMRTKPTVQATAPEGSRLATLRAEAAKGQNALDRGTSLEQEARDKSLTAQRAQEVAVTTAANPPRSSTAGTASQPKPALDPQKQAALTFAKDKYNQAARFARDNPDNKDAQAAVKEAEDAWRNELNNVPRAGILDWLKTALNVGGAKAPVGEIQTNPPKPMSGGTRDNPARPKTLDEASKLPKGAFFYDNDGILRQRS